MGRSSTGGGLESMYLVKEAPVSMVGLMCSNFGLRGIPFLEVMFNHENEDIGGGKKIPLPRMANLRSSSNLEILLAVRIISRCVGRRWI